MKTKGIPDPFNPAELIKLDVVLGRGANARVYSVSDKDGERQHYVAKIYLGNDSNALKALSKNAVKKSMRYYKSVLGVPNPPAKHVQLSFRIAGDVTKLSIAFLPLVKGRCLGAYICRHGQTLKAQELEHLFKKIFQLLADVHGKGFRHCDPHLDNILIDDDGELAFVDFDTMKKYEDNGRDVCYLASSILDACVKGDVELPNSLIQLLENCVSPLASKRFTAEQCVAFLSDTNSVSTPANDTNIKLALSKLERCLDSWIGEPSLLSDLTEMADKQFSAIKLYALRYRLRRIMSHKVHKVFSKTMQQYGLERAFVKALMMLDGDLAFWHDFEESLICHPQTWLELGRNNTIPLSRLALLIVGCCPDKLDSLTKGNACSVKDRKFIQQAAKLLPQKNAYNLICQLYRTIYSATNRHRFHAASESPVVKGSLSSSSTQKLAVRKA